MRKFAVIVVLVFASAAMLTGQALPPPDPLTPEEYDPDEFGMWAHDLRRYEVITVGSFPVTFFATSLIYDFSIYASNDFNPSYSMGTQRDGRDIGIIMGTAAIASLVIATVDLIINVNKRKKTEGSENES